MSDCVKRGCRNFETYCADCGRFIKSVQLEQLKVDEGNSMPNKSNEIKLPEFLSRCWLNFFDSAPPKDESFLALTTYGVEIMKWKERIVDGENKGWFGFACSCACCSGFCTDNFTHWMPLPKPPED